MSFILYTGAHPNHKLIGHFDTVSAAINHGEIHHPEEHMFINYDYYTVRIYSPYFKTWSYANHN